MKNAARSKQVMGENAPKVAALILSVCLGLAFCEVGLRMLYPQNLGISYKTRDGLIILRPNHKGIARGVDRVQEIQTNSFGMRDREHPIEKEGSVFRILLLGDSFMEALQVKFERAFPKLLEDKLKESTQEAVEVINAAVSGWGTDEQLTYLERYGRNFRPDLILIAMTLHNDVYDNLQENFHTILGNSLTSKDIEEIPFVAYKIWQLKAFLGSRLHSYQLFRRWWHSKSIETDGRQLSAHVLDLVQNEPSQRLAKGWSMTYELLRKINKTGRQIGAATVVLLNPLMIQVDENKLVEFLVNHDLSTDSVFLERPQQLIKAFGDVEAIEVIDMLPHFRSWTKRYEKPLFLPNDGHWTEDGHEAAANIVSEALAEAVLARRERQINHALERVDRAYQ